jgi:prephenate dehydrogenase
MGTLFTGALTGDGRSVIGIDLCAAPGSALRADHHIVSDVTAPAAQALAAVGGADVVLACLHEAVLLRAIDAILPAMRPGALLVDTLSIKTPLAERLRGARSDIEVLSIDPLFAPSVGFGGQNLIAVELRGGARSRAFIERLEAWGARVTRMSAEEHDRAAAAIQVATHASVIAFGMCLRRMGHDIDKALPVTTPPHRAMLALLARIMTANPDVYWEIQTMNPFAAEARAALAQSLAELTGILDGGDRDAFRGLFAGGRDALGAHAAPFARYCAELFALEAPGRGG